MSTSPNATVKHHNELAYLVTEYPKVSHSFIRREILAIEAFGWRVHRLAIRPAAGTLADAQDRAEHDKTHHILSQPVPALLWAGLVTLLTRPIKWCRAFGVAMRMHRANDRGLIRHLAYLVEACYLLRYCRRHGIRHIHVHFATNGATVARLTRCLGGPSYSLTIHGPTDFDAPIGQSLGQKVEDSEFIAVISAYCGAQVRRWVGPEQWDKLHEVHCAVNEAFLSGTEPIPRDSNTLLCIGRLSAQKLHIVLIDALAKVRDRGVACRLVLAGDGELRSLIDTRIGERCVTDLVEITGWIDESEVRNRLRESRALVLASAAEGLPVVIMEALAMGRPVVSTPVAGIPELVNDGEHGWLVPAGDVDALADAMIAVLQAQVEQLERMGVAGAERVRERHRASTEAAKLDRLFTNVLCDGGTM